MPQYQITVPGQGKFRVNSPTDLTDEQVWAAVQGQLTAPAPVEPPKKEGFGAALGKGIEGLISPTRTAFGAVTGSPEEAALAGLKRAEASPYAEQVSLEKVKQAYERGLLPAAGEVLRQIPLAITEQLPNIAATLGSARVGAMAGAPLGPYGAIGGGILGAVAPSLLQQFGGNIQRQAQEQLAAKQPVDISRTSAIAAAVPQAGLDVAATLIPLGRTVAGAVLGPQVKQLLEAGAKESAEKLARESLPTVLAKGAGISIASEAPTEAVQSMLERAQAGLPLLSEDALKEYGEAAYQAALIAPIGAAARVGERSAARQQPLMEGMLPGETERQAAERLQAEILAMKQAAQPAPPGPILSTNNLYNLMAQPNGYGLVEQYKQRLMAMPEQTPEIKKAIEDAAFAQRRSVIEAAERRAPRAPVEKPKGGKDVGKAVPEAGGAGVPVAGEPGARPAAEGAGAPVPGGVVPAVEDVGQPAGGEAKPSAPVVETAPIVTTPETTRDAVAQHAVKGLPIIEAPIEQLSISKDVPQFKSEADVSGIVKPLEGKFERTGVAPIQLWRRADGRLEVISGRHRFDLAKRSGETTIPAQIHDEAAGFDAAKAATLDAELNIRDEQGEVKDYVVYFERSGISEADAKARGLLGRPVGQRGWTIASKGSPDLIAAHRAGIVPDDAAAGIAAVAPGDARLQAVGIKAIRDNKSAQAAINTVQAVKAMAAEKGAPQEEAGDLFGFDDSAIKEAEEMARIATEKQRAISSRLAAITGAANKPAVAKAEGIDIKDEAALNKRVQELRQVRAAWNNWSSNPTLVKEIRDEMAPPLAVEIAATAPTAAAAEEPAKKLSLRLNEVIQEAKSSIEAQIKDWSSRVYKANKRQVELAGDGPSRQASMSVSQINESKRRRAVEGLQAELKAVRDLEKQIADPEMAERLLNKAKRLFKEAQERVATGEAQRKDAGLEFEATLLSELGIRPPRGAYESNNISKAIRRVVETLPAEPEVAEQEAKPYEPLTAQQEEDVLGLFAVARGEPKKSLVEMRKRYEAARAALPAPEAPAEIPPERQKLNEEIQKKLDQLEKVLTRIMSRFGLKDVALKIVEDLRDANAEYSENLIRLALDAANPVRNLRHESIHALKELGFFTPQQWNTLQRQAQDKWIDQYLRNVNVNQEPLSEGEQSRFDAYNALFQKQAEKLGLEGDNASKFVNDAIIEEAIADAFGEFDVKKPVGLMQSILQRMRNLFTGLKNGFNGLGYQTAEDVFAGIEKGTLKPEKAVERKAEPKASLRVIDMTERRARQLVEEENAEVRQMLDERANWQRGRDLETLKDKIYPWLKEHMYAVDKARRVYSEVGVIPGIQAREISGSISSALDKFEYIAKNAYTGVYGEVRFYGPPNEANAFTGTRYAENTLDNSGKEIVETVDDYLKAVEEYRAQLNNRSSRQREMKKALAEILDNVVVGKFAKPSLRAPQTEAFKKWSGGAPVIGLRQDHVFVSGKPVVVEALHGTTNADITEFKKSKANIESDFGAGFYASNTPADVAINYANVEGADLTRRIETLAERIADNEEFEGDMNAAMEEARKRLSQGAPNTMKLYMLFKNPAVLGGKGETFFDYTQSYNEETDEYGEPTGSLVDFVTQLDEIGEGIDISIRDVERAKQDLIDAARDNEGLKFSELAQIVKDRFSDTYDLEDGSAANGEVLRQALEGMGFDGVIDTSAYSKFGPRMIRGAYSMIKTEGMAGLDKDTVHFVAFKPTQIKSATGNIGTFDITKPDIRYSLRDAAKIDLDRSLNDKRISPRLPTAVKAKEDAMGEVRLQPDLDTFKRDDVAFRHNIGLMSKYPNFSHIKGTPAQRAEQMIEHMKGNLLWLFNSWDAKLRDRSKLWYVGGNRISHRWAEKYGIPAEQAAGIIAALSPQKDWFQNVSLAERTLDALVFNADTTWSPEMTQVFKERAWAKKFPLKKYQGTTLKDMYRPGDAKSLVDMAVWIRAWDEANNVQTARVITPEGTFTNEMAAGKTGKPVAMRAQSFAAMVKTLQVLQQSDLKVISDLIGKNHKVRSFYNNIIAPYAGDDVTIDTHAVAAALLRPLGSSDLEVYHNFGSAKPAKKDKEGNILVPASAGTKNSAVTGLYGTYAMYAEAYRRAAQEAGVLPREMQSITWEAIRGLFRPEQKQAKLKNQTNVLWNKVGKGEIDGQTARDEISKLVSGIEDPAWAKSPVGANESRTDSSYADELPGVGVPGREPAGVPSRTGERVAGAVPERGVKFSLRSSVPRDIHNRIVQTTVARDEKGFVQRITEAISPKSFSTFRAAALHRYNQLGVNDQKLADQMGGKVLLANVAAEPAALLSDLGAGLTASALGVHDRVGGVPVYKNGITTISNLNGTVKGAVEIFVPLAKLNDPYAYQAYGFWAGVKRGSRFMADGREQLFEPADIKRAEDLRKQFLKMGVDFEAIQKEWIKYNNGLVDYMVDTGVLSKDRADIYKKHSDYLPFYRQMDGVETVGPKIFQAISGVKPPKKLKGGEAPIDDFLENIVRNTQAAIQAGVKNVAAQRAADVAVKIGIADRLPYQSSAPNTFQVLENGKVVTYDCQDMLTVNAIKSLGLPDLPFIGMLSGPANLLRNLVTKDPGFMLANLMRDSMSAWVTSGVKMKPMVDTISNFGSALVGKDPAFQALMNAGILGGYEFSQNVEQSGREFGKALRKQAGVRTPGYKGILEMGAKPFTSLWEALEKGTTASDAATRMEVYKKTLAETGNEAEALYRALEVMNFNRKGSSAVIRVLTAAVPFLNARMQGLDVLYRAASGKMVSEQAAETQKRFFVRGATIMALSAAYWLLTHDDDEYKKQEQETRDNYWLLPSLGVKIPIPFEIGVLFKVIPERIFAYTFGSDTGEDFLKSMGRQLTTTLAFNPIPQTALPVVEAMTNFSFFTMRPIVGQGLEGVQPAYQVGPGTSRLAEKIGAATKGLATELQISPMKLDQLINGYTGTMGMYLVNLMDAVYDMNTDSPKPSMRFERMPLIRRFALDPEARGSVTAYYELKNSVDSIVRTSNMLERTMNYEELPGYLQDNMKMLAAKDYLLDLEKTMKEFREMKILIRSSQMDADAKKDAILSIDQMENQLTSNIQYLKSLAKGG